MTQYMGIKIDEARDKLLSEKANKLLKDYYCHDGENSPQHYQPHHLVIKKLKHYLFLVFYLLYQIV